jgi:hypothetical protein
MTGRIRRKAVPGPASLPRPPEALTCPLCDRLIPPAQRDAHHLVPRSKGGRQTEYLHRICHRQVHALLTETELAREYSTVEALQAHPGMVQFLAWVRGKPPDFSERTRKSARIRKKPRR